MEEDGTVIPASEDEVIKVESFFEGETSPQVSDSRMLKDVDGIIYEQNENIDSSGKFLAGMLFSMISLLLIYIYLAVVCLLFIKS